MSTIDNILSLTTRFYERNGRRPNIIKVDRPTWHRIRSELIERFDIEYTPVRGPHPYDDMLLLMDYAVALTKLSNPHEVVLG